MKLIFFRNVKFVTLVNGLLKLCSKKMKIQLDNILKSVEFIFR